MDQQPKPRNYQSEDTWSRTTSLRGFPIDELRSVLQKSIRRGWVEDAAIAAFEFFSSGPDAEEVLWRRLEIIATEDVGLGMPTAPAVINALYQQAGRMADPGDRWIYCAHAVRLLATAPKDNMSMELSNWTREVVERGERAVDVKDFMVDIHTRRGVEMGRTPDHWWDNGAKLENRIAGYDPKWGDYMRKLAGAKLHGE
ncbi:AAA family ATPase [Granulicella cerasi]|uniref:AAA family ATPase n=1 Tax=Granulicella cerasi TaxID=741063 RepID=A0ABW1ZA25_9BACT|nr:AAA family ATPase [Granulicella cerasi]